MNVVVATIRLNLLLVWVASYVILLRDRSLLLPSRSPANGVKVTWPP